MTRGNGGFTLSSLRCIALEDLQIVTTAFERAFHEVRDQVFLEPHVIVRIVPGDFRLEHPELGEVTARLGFFGAERRPEGVDLPERRRGGFAVQLTGLGEVGLLLEVVDLEQARTAFADRAGDDRCIYAEEATLIEEIVNRASISLRTRMIARCCVERSQR